MNEKTPTLSDEPKDEPVQDESAKRQALQEALKNIDKLDFLNAIFYLNEHSQSPESQRLETKLLELMLHKVLNQFQKADLSGETTIRKLAADLGHVPTTSIDYYVFHCENLHEMISPEVNELAIKIVKLEAVRAEAHKSADTAMEYYEFVGDQAKMDEMQTRIQEDERRMQAGGEVFRIDESIWFNAVKQFVEDTKDFPVMSKEEIEQHVSEVRDEVQQMLEQVGESEE